VRAEIAKALGEQVKTSIVASVAEAIADMLLSETEPKALAACANACATRDATLRQALLSFLEVCTCVAFVECHHLHNITNVSLGIV
jgi:hypothetical protein